jgi:hypothetical protein
MKYPSSASANVKTIPSSETILKVASREWVNPGCSVSFKALAIRNKIQEEGKSETSE